MPIRVIYFAFVLIGFGTMIQNRNLNILYTITNPILLTLADTLKNIGSVIVENMPFLFVLALVSKRKNNGIPTILGLVGYITFLVMTALWTSGSFPAQVYHAVLGVALPTKDFTATPLQTGLIGAFLVSIAVRYSFLKSRKRSPYSLLTLVDKDIAALIQTVFLCAVLGLTVAFIWPILLRFYLRGIAWIAKDLSDPKRLFAYGLADRLSALFGVGDLIRKPFWFGVEGGSFASITGKVILGDVNIWEHMPNAANTFHGAGRFITPYYVINMFIIPAIYLGLYFSYDNAKERKKHLFFLLATLILSFLIGNPLPLELLLLCTAPLLLALYLVGVGGLFVLLSLSNAFIGFRFNGVTSAAMPGSFVDYIINIRMGEEMRHALVIILIIGIIFAVVYFLITLIYYRFLAYDLAGGGKAKKYAGQIIHAVGGIDNISDIRANPFDLKLELVNTELVSYDEIKQVGAKRVIETSDGLTLDYCSASKIIKKALQKTITESKK